MPFRLLAFALLSLAIALVNWPVVTAVVAYSRSDETASHLILIPAIAAGLVFMERRRIFATVSTWWAGGAALVALAALGTLWALPQRAVLAQDPALTLASVPIVLGWMGAFLLAFGRQAARAALFPLLFLLFTVPIPALLLNAANDFLKASSTEVVAALFTATGTPYVRDGYVFQLPFIAIEVADACSGIRSSIGMLITSLLAGYMFLRSPINRTLLCLAIIPVTVFKNGVRIVTLSLLSIHVDPSFLTGQLHHEGGIVFFVLALALLAPVLYLLVRAERPSRPPAPRRPDALPAVS